MSGVKNTDPISSKRLLAFVQADDGGVCPVSAGMADGGWNVYALALNREPLMPQLESVHVICPLDSEVASDQGPPS